MRALVRPPTSRQQKAPTVPPLVTLPELRAMTDLAQTVDRRVDQLGVACSDDSESENESDPLQHSAVTSAPSALPGKLKSGREAKAISSQFCLSHTSAARGQIRGVNIGRIRGWIRSNFIM